MLHTKEEIYYAILIISIFSLLFIVIIITTAVLYYNRKKSHLAERAKFDQILLLSQLEIKEQTLHYIARELHDNLGQVASLIKINLNTIKFDNLDITNRKIEDTRELVRQLIVDLKLLSISLNGDRIVQHGLARSLEVEIERLNKTGQYQASLKHGGIPTVIDSNTTIILFRMVQEILNNAVKHSAATKIAVSLEVKENLFTLVCVDDGVGFDVKERAGHGGSGLLNLHSRAKLINASLTIDSRPQQGTTVSIQLPL